MSRNAIVVGGGIGGLAAARALLLSGWEVTVLEQAPGFEAVGAGLALEPNGVRALDWLGLGDELRARGMAQGAAGLRTASGRWLLRTRFEELERRFGLPTFALHRADLHQMLTASLEGARLRTGHEVQSVTWDADQATVTYQTTGGSGEESADLVVAADGVHSRLRSELFSDHPGVSYAGYITWRGVVPASAAGGIEAEAFVTETWGRGKRFGVVPLADGQVYWFAGASLPEGTHVDDTVADVAARHRGWHAPIPQLLDLTPPQSLLRHDIYHLDVPLTHYVQGRVALLGDAAHAMTPDLGQGACQALEDAVTLATALDGADHGEIPAGLLTYDEARRPRTQGLVRASAQAGRVAQWHHPVLAGLRNLAVWLAPTSLFFRVSAGTLGWTPPRALTTR
jgi:2-polyprenyl-6-methoxyphenol hydroxylase-like FAD-dependent oxidoreductase